MEGRRNKASLWVKALEKLLWKLMKVGTEMEIELDKNLDRVLVEVLQ
jgi:hypothetical protein